MEDILRLRYKRHISRSIDYISRYRSRGIDLCLIFLTINILFIGSCSSSVLTKSLIYGQDAVQKNVTYYCEFAPMTTFALPGTLNQKCRSRNPHMRKIVNGKILYPWRKYSFGMNGLLLECPALHKNVTLTKCSEERKVYSVCSFSCPDGYVTTSSKVECLERAPITNISAAWSLDEFCKKLVTSKISLTISVQGDDYRAENRSVEIDPKIDKSTNDNRNATDEIIIIVVVVVAVIIGFAVIVVIVLCLKNKYPRLLCPCWHHSSQDKDDLETIELEGFLNSHGSKGLNYSAKPDTADVSHLSALAPKSLNNSAKPDTADVSHLSALAPKALDDGASCEQGKESQPYSCDTLIRLLTNLSHVQIRRLGSVLEYYDRQKKEHTLYGYMLENWEKYKFSCLREVQMIQSHSDYRKGDTPFEHFLQHLIDHGASFRDLFLYFKSQRANEVISVLLEFHHCDSCKNEFGRNGTPHNPVTAD